MSRILSPQAVASATLVGAVACATSVQAAPYITIDLLARPAELNANRYTVANGSGGYTSLAGYQASSPGSSILPDNTGFTDTLSNGVLGAPYELLIQVTLATAGTTNAFAAPGFTSISKLNPSNDATAPSGMNSLVFNLGMSSLNAQASFLKVNQGRGFIANPGGNGNTLPVLDPTVVIDRTRNSGGTGVWDNFSGAKSGTLTNRGNGNYDVSNVALIRNAGTFAGVGGTRAVPIIQQQYLAVSYFTLTNVSADNTLGINFDNLDLSSPDGPIAAVIGSLRWRDAADTTNITYQITSTQQAASLLGGDPLIKINPLSILASSGIPSAAITVNPDSGNVLSHGAHVTISNVATGALVDPAAMSDLVINTTLANGSWSQAGLSQGDIAGNGGTQVGTVSANFGPNILKGAKLLGDLSFIVAGKTQSATYGEGGYGYALEATKQTNVAFPGSGISFGTAQTAALEPSIQLRNNPLSSTQAGTTITLADSTASESFVMASVEWRHRSTLEYTGATGYGHPGLISDVLKLTLGGTAPDAYVMMLTYDPTALGGMTETQAFTSGNLYIAHMTPGADTFDGTLDDAWTLVGFGPPDSLNIRPYIYADLNNVGAYGVDTVTHTLWAVLPGSMQGQFAVVPEPASLAVLGIGSLLLMRRNLSKNR